MLFCSSVATDGSATTVGSIASLTVRRSTAARCTSVKTSAVITAVTAANNTNCLPDTRYISRPSFARRSGAMPSIFQIITGLQGCQTGVKTARPPISRLGRYPTAAYLLLPMRDPKPFGDWLNCRLAPAENVEDQNDDRCDKQQVNRSTPGACEPE